MAQDLIPQALGQYCTRKQAEPILLDGKVQPYDFNGTNTNRLTGEELEREGRNGWCYDFSDQANISRVSVSDNLTRLKKWSAYIKATSSSSTTQTEEGIVRFSITREGNLAVGSSTNDYWLRIANGGVIGLKVPTAGSVPSGELTGTTDLTSGGFFLIELEIVSGVATVKVNGSTEITFTLEDGAGTTLSDYNFRFFQNTTDSNRLYVIGAINDVLLTSFSGLAYDLQITYEDDTFDKWLLQEESGTISYNIGEDVLGEGALTAITHSQDDDVTFSDANDRGAGVALENILLDRIPTKLQLTTQLDLTGEFKIEATITPYFNVANQNSSFLIGRFSSDYIRLSAISNGIVLFFNGINLGSFIAVSPFVYGEEIVLILTRNGSNDLSCTINGVPATGTINSSSTLRVRELFPEGVTSDPIKISNVKIWDGSTGTGQSDYEWNPIQSVNDIGDSGSPNNLLDNTLQGHVIPLLENGTTPANSNITQAQYLGQYKPYFQVVDSPCLNFTNTASNQLEFTDLTGVASVTNEGTATLTISGNNLVINSGADDGTVFGVKLWSGAGGTGTLIEELPCNENAGSVANGVYDTANYSATIGGTLTNVWSLTQDVYSYAQAKGISVSSGSGSVPFGGFIPSALDSNGNSTGFDVEGNVIPDYHLSGRGLRLNTLENLDVNPENLPALNQMNYDQDGTENIIPINSLDSLFAALKWRKETDDILTNGTLFKRGIDNLAPCLNFDGTNYCNIYSSGDSSSAGYYHIEISFWFKQSGGQEFPSSFQRFFNNSVIWQGTGAADNTEYCVFNAPSFSIEDNKWHFYKFVFNRNGVGSNLPSDYSLMTFNASIDGESLTINTLPTSITPNAWALGVAFGNVRLGGTPSENPTYNGQITGFKIVDLSTNRILEFLPTVEGVGNIVNNIGSGADPLKVQNGEIVNETGNEWAIRQKVYDYLGAYGGNEYEGVTLSESNFELDNTLVVGAGGADFTLRFKFIPLFNVFSSPPNFYLGARTSTDGIRLLIGGLDEGLLFIRFNNAELFTFFSAGLDPINFLDSTIVVSRNGANLNATAYYGENSNFETQTISTSVAMNIPFLGGFASSGQGSGIFKSVEYWDSYQSGVNELDVPVTPTNRWLNLDQGNLLDTGSGTANNIIAFNITTGLLPSQLPLNGTDVKGNNLPTEELERVLDQQQGLALNQKI